MTQEEKKLLLKDLCARLPYGVMFNYDKNEPLKVEGIVRDIIYFKGYNYQTEGDECYADITQCKPYLRPMSSMTEEELNEYENFITNEKDDQLRFCNELVFYNRHHFDYHGLIPKELALPAPEGMYNIQ